MLEICRTCLKVPIRSNYISLRNNPKAAETSRNFELLVPEIILNLVVNPIVCGTCINKLEMGTNFIRRSQRIEDYIRTYSNSYCPPLIDIYKSLKANQDKELEPKQICRTCLTGIKTDFSDLSPKEFLQTMDELKTCVPEVMLNLVSDPDTFLCMSCASDLHAIYNFILQCQCIENCIRSYVKDMKLHGRRLVLIDVYQELHELSLMYKDNSGFKNEIWSEIDLVKEEIVVKIEDDVKLEVLGESNDFEGDYEKDSYHTESESQECFLPLDRLPESVFDHDLLNGALTQPLEDDRVRPQNKTKSRVRAKLEVRAKLLRSAKNTVKSKIFACTQCQFTTTCKFSLEIHEHRHAEIKPFSCTWCNYKANNQTNYRKHLFRIHQYTHRCQFRATYQNDFVRNSQSCFHTWQYVICDVCGYMKERESSDSFFCELCKFQTRYLGHYKRHIKIHIIGTTYSCKKCRFWTGYKDKLNQHVKDCSCTHTLDEDLPA